jgi:hypothetical protein
MHPWTEPAEVLLAQASTGLVMPRLGEPVEPAHVETVTPWWRDVEPSWLKNTTSPSVAASRVADGMTR